MFKRFLSSSVEEFRVFDATGGKLKTTRRLRPPRRVPIPRYKRMKVDQDWTKVWPNAQSFRASVVPLPIRQGMVTSMLDNEGIIPAKDGNAELMKIPNFLHLTPPHVEQQCRMIKKFCTKFPDELKSANVRKVVMPVEIETVDYVQSACSIRDERARVVTIMVPLDAFQLSERSRDKLKRILGPNRYDSATDKLIIKAEKCPYRRQNLAYAKYLLEVVYNESVKKEDWEDWKCQDDWERFYWESSEAKKGVEELLERSDAASEDGLDDAKLAYGKSIGDLFDKETNDMDIYKKSVQRLIEICSKK